MAGRKKLTRTPPKDPVILDEAMVLKLSRGVVALLGPPAVELAQGLGVHLDDVVRFLAVKSRCVAAREKAGLTLQDVAKQLRVPQYRIRDIESGHLNRITPSLLREYIELLGLTAWYEEWSLSNPELVRWLEGGISGSRSTTLSSAEMIPPSGVSFQGEVLAVKARIRLLRSFDQISHQYQGFTLVIASGEPQSGVLRVAIGPAAQAKHQFRIGDLVSGKGQPVQSPKIEWVDLYKASQLRLEKRGSEDQARPADPEGGIAPPLEVYRANGHRRLDPKTCEAKCTRCPFGLTMVTEIILDQWNPSRKRWRLETHCYGPKGCPRHRAGAPRKVPGRKPGMVWVDNDIEREAEQ
jgi:transcriptional regulator with XRE-family HTH domain